MQGFHPAVNAWFNNTFESPTQPQLDAWAAIEDGDHVLVAAPTGSGKTFAAFLKVIDGLAHESARGMLQQQVSVVYVSPLKALSNDIRRNLEEPLAGIHREMIHSAEVLGFGPQRIEAAVRTGDTPQGERVKMIKAPPHILVTTPESLYILLTSESGRKMLGSAKTLIIDEIHALVGTKRGAHLALSMERLENLCSAPLVRIGLSATQEPVNLVAHFLTGRRKNDRDCRIIDSGHQRNRDLEICLPDSPLEAVMAGEVWSEVYGKLEALIASHNTTLIFVNTRRLAERLSKALAERLGDEAVTSHHGSLAKEHRFAAEQKLKTGQLKALVATASLELGIDIGDVDLVCQIGSPRAVSVLLQRVGRSGHSLGKTPKGRLFPLSRDDLVECVAVIDSVQRGELDQLSLYPHPLDVLAQQLVAEVAAGERNLDEIFSQFTVAASYCSLARERFDQVVQMLADGFSTRRGRRSAHIHLDAVNGMVRPRKGARLTAITNGGTIPDQFDYDVILQPDNLKIGTLNEDFSFESLPGDVFQLGNTSYMILRVELGKVFVQNAKGQPPNIPFWFGEAPGRTDAVSVSVSRLRSNMEIWLGQGSGNGLERATLGLIEQYNVSREVADQMVNYLGAAYAALGALPTHDTVIFERFFDEAGDQHLVIHSAFGSRVNRAWGLSLRKRFCRKFNFELQAAALEDTIVLSLGSTHSFPLEEPAGYLKPASVEEVLVQALLDAPMFPTHWRWNASISLAVRRFSNGKKTPPQFQRSNAEDLIAVVFPDQIACAENIAGQREIPDHPLVEQTLYDCLHDLMDIDGLVRLLERLGEGSLQLVCRDLTAPSPLSEEVLTAKPYAFLDDAPAEERRTSLVRTRQYLHPEDAAVLDILDKQVINEVRLEAWPDASNEDECHDGLLILSAIDDAEALKNNWNGWLQSLAQARRAYYFKTGGVGYWVAAERLDLWFLLHPDIVPEPAQNQFDIGLKLQGTESLTPEATLIELVRMRLQGLGPVRESVMAKFMNVDGARISASFLALENEGYAMRGEFEPASPGLSDDIQWCERGLLARIHKRTISNLRKQVKPASINNFMRFLFDWQGLDEDSRSSEDDPEQLAVVLDQLEGLEMPAGAWEESILPARMKNYMPYWLDILCSSGRITWARFSGSQSTKPVMDNKVAGSQSTGLINRGMSRGSGKQSPVAFSSRHAIAYWMDFSRRVPLSEIDVSNQSRKLINMLEQNGAQFFEDLVARGGWLAAEVEQSLSELVGLGVVCSDNFAGLRGLVKTGSNSTRGGSRRSGASGKSVMGNAGRWSLVGAQSTSGSMEKATGVNPQSGVDDKWQSIEYIAGVLLRRYGVVFRKLLEAEKNLPPWRDLHYVYRRMEARGEIRGGRFVNGFAGEQFAVPDAVGLLRKMEKQSSNELVSISGADPLNLTGIIIPGKRVPAIRKNRLLFRDGKLVARFVSGEIQWETELSPGDQWNAKQKLIRVPAGVPGKYRHYRNPQIH
jgi:ATP-dependent Lhr-like helicase